MGNTRLHVHGLLIVRVLYRIFHLGVGGEGEKLIFAIACKAHSSSGVRGYASQKISEKYLLLD